MQADVNSTETEGGGRARAVRSSTGIFTPAKVAPVLVESARYESEIKNETLNSPELIENAL